MKIKSIYKTKILFFTLTIILSCNQKKDTQIDNTTIVDGYKIAPVPAPKGLSVEELDARV